MPAPGAVNPLRTVGRYALYDEIASGGMASVHLGRLIGPVGFARTVAIKRLHPQYAKDPEFVAMFIDEARLAARVQHPNVVSTLDVVDMDDELFVVMDYVQGESLSALMRKARERDAVVPHGIVAGILVNALHGLHAAHEASDERGAPLHIVHRDVSPQNIMVGVDGVARVLDFGVAKATLRMQATRDGQVKGKLRYMSPEQISGTSDRRTDIFAAGVVLWEALTGLRLFDGDNAAAILARVLHDPILSPSSVRPSVSPALDVVVMRALERDVTRRYQTARDMALALEHTGVAPGWQIGEWVEAACRDVLLRRVAQIAEVERSEAASSGGGPHNATRGPTVATVIASPASTPSSHTVGSASQVSSLSVATTTMPERPRDTARAALLAVLAVVVTALVILGVARAGRSADQEPAAKPGSATLASTAEPGVPTHEPDAAAATPHESALPPVSLDALPVEPTPATHAPAGRPNVGGARPMTAKQRDCAVPFTVDRDGIRQPKPECL